jgi:hypothetical protein
MGAHFLYIDIARANKEKKSSQWMALFFGTLLEHAWAVL